MVWIRTQKKIHLIDGTDVHVAGKVVCTDTLTLGTYADHDEAIKVLDEMSYHISTIVQYQAMPVLLKVAEATKLFIFQMPETGFSMEDEDERAD